jgi:hypothetical protein
MSANEFGVDERFMAVFGGVDSEGEPSYLFLLRAFREFTI